MSMEDVLRGFFGFGALHPPTYTTPRPVAWLATLQKRFMEGRDCDVVVRVPVVLFFRHDTAPPTTKHTHPTYAQANRKPSTD
jgi:hypothetical protein